MKKPAPWSASFLPDFGLGHVSYPHDLADARFEIHKLS